MSKLTIRAYQPGDRPAIMALWQAAGLSPSGIDVGAHIDAAIGQSNAVLLVGTIDNDMVATTMAGVVGHRGWLHYVATLRQLRGQGIGRQMMTAAAAWLKTHGATQQMLLVREDNPSALAFYDRLGWDRQTHIVLQRPID